MILDPSVFMRNSCDLCNTIYDDTVRICRKCKHPTRMSFKIDAFKKNLTGLIGDLPHGTIKQRQILKMFKHKEMQDYLADAAALRLSRLFIQDLSECHQQLSQMMDSDPEFVGAAMRMVSSILKRLKISISHRGEPERNPLMILMYRYAKQKHEMAQFETLMKGRPKIFADLKVKTSAQKKMLDRSLGELSRMQAFMRKVPDYVDMYHRFIESLQFVDENEVPGEMKRMKLEYEVIISTLRSMNDFTMPNEKMLEGAP